MAAVQRINSLLNNFLGLEIIKTRPKEAIKFAKKFFGGREIIALEVGVLRGENSKAMLGNLNIRKLYLVDPYAKYVGYEKDAAYLNLSKAKGIAERRLKRFKRNLIWIRDYSENALKKIKEKIDFIYIDGNHEYPYVMKDLVGSWKILKKRGILSGHDIQYPGVSKAVLEFTRKRKLEVNFGERRDWWVIKT